MRALPAQENLLCTECNAAYRLAYTLSASLFIGKAEKKRAVGLE